MLIKHAFRATRPVLGNAVIWQKAMKEREKSRSSSVARLWGNVIAFRMHNTAILVRDDMLGYIWSCSWSRDHSIDAMGKCIWHVCLGTCISGLHNIRIPMYGDTCHALILVRHFECYKRYYIKIKLLVHQENSKCVKNNRTALNDAYPHILLSGDAKCGIPIRREIL